MSFLKYNLQGLKVSNTLPFTDHFTKENIPYITNDRQLNSLYYPFSIDILVKQEIKLKYEIFNKCSIHFLQIHLWGDYYFMIMINKNGTFRTYGIVKGVKVMRERDYPDKPYTPKIYFISTEKDNEILEGEIEINYYLKKSFMPYIFTIWSDNIKLLRDNLIESGYKIGFKINDIHIEDIVKAEGNVGTENYRNATTQKPKYIYKVLMNRPLNSYVLFVDCDTMFYEDNYKWREYLETLFNKQMDIVFQEDQSYPFNSGFQYIHNTEKVRDFYKSVCDYFENEECDYGNFTYDQEIMTIFLYHSGLKWCCADKYIIAGNPKANFHKSKEVIENALFYHTYGIQTELLSGIGFTQLKLKYMKEIEELKIKLKTKEKADINIFNIINEKNKVLNV